MLAFNVWNLKHPDIAMENEGRESSRTWLTCQLSCLWVENFDLASRQLTLRDQLSQKMTKYSERLPKSSDVFAIPRTNSEIFGYGRVEFENRATPSQNKTLTPLSQRKTVGIT